MKKEKGFTLIELLAVIVILAIIALIATPIVLNLINKARKGAAARSAEGIRKSAQTYYYSQMVVNPVQNMTTKTYNFATTGEGGYNGEFNFDGKTPSAGTVTIAVDGKVTGTGLIIDGFICRFEDSGSATCEKVSDNSKGGAKNTITQSEFIQNLKVGELIKMVPTHEKVQLDGSKTGYSTEYKVSATANPVPYDVEATYLDPSELVYWRVISKNENGTVDVVSEYVSSTKVYFKGVSGYANLAGYLTELASYYENPTYTVGSRHFGYDGQTKEITNTGQINCSVGLGNATSTSTPTEGTGAEYGDGVLGDTLYLKDYLLVGDVYKALNNKKRYGTTGLIAYAAGTETASSYWLPSRRMGRHSDSQYYFYVRSIGTLGSLSEEFVRYCTTGRSYSKNHTIRPILTLKSDITSSGVEEETGAYLLD